MTSSALRTPYPSDVSDDEWAVVAPYLPLMTPDAPQRRHDLREVDNALRWIMRTGAQWRDLPHEFPPWEAVYQQTQRWIAAGVFEAMVRDLRALLRWLQGRADDPTATIIDSRTVPSTPESGHRAGYDGHKRRQGSKIHAAVDTLGALLDESASAHAGHGAHGIDSATPKPEPEPEPIGTPAAQAFTGEGAAEVHLVDDRFDPVWLEVPAGTTVTWVSHGADWHNVASSKAGFASDRIAPGESYSFTFEEPGEFKVVCRHHGLAGMNATVVVTG